MKKISDKWDTFRRVVIRCRKCPRLVDYRENVPPKPAFQGQKFWRKPLPGFGDPNAWLLFTGLAPAGDGGNRTGRIFTGDGTARFLIKALYREGLANQPTSESMDDGLILHGCYMTAAVKCLPPEHKPTRQECLNCNPYYVQEIEMLSHLKAVLLMGHLAFNAFLLTLKKQKISNQHLVFKHGASYTLDNGLRVYCSYHPTPRNVNTGLLTEKMFLNLLKRIKNETLK